MKANHFAEERLMPVVVVVVGVVVKRDERSTDKKDTRADTKEGDQQSVRCPEGVF